MPILQLRILPPVAIGRLGSSPTPLEAFELRTSEANPLDYRSIVPRETLEIDPGSGAVARGYVPESIRFKEPDGRIRPVAPFLEVLALTGKDELVPLTTALLAAEGLSLEALHWSVEVGNLKLFRRTGDPGDKILARLPCIQDHRRYTLAGECAHFLPGKTLPLGSVRFIQPTADFPQIRLRYTPAAGKVYGSSLERHVSDTVCEPDPVITTEDRVLYDTGKGRWRGYRDESSPTLTNPAQIYAGYDNADGVHVSWDYLDDECDGVASAHLTLADGTVLSAHAHISAG